MKTRLPRLWALALLLTCPAAWVGPASAASSSPPAARGDFATGFIENRGQLDDSVRYCARDATATVYLTADAIVFNVKEGPPRESAGRELDAPGPLADPPRSQMSTRRGCAVWLSFVGADPSRAVLARGELATRYHYFLGSDPDGWRTDVPAYAEIVYRSLWPGVDVVFRDAGGAITYEVLAEPGADPTRVRFQYEGADRVTMRDDGTIWIDTPIGSFPGLRPVSADGGKDADRIGPNSPLGESAVRGDRDNPDALQWSTFLGAGDLDYPYGLALDPTGCPVVVGETRSWDFPTTPGAYDESYNGGLYDAYVAKLDPTGSALLWSTVLGGAFSDKCNGVGCDASGNPVVSGRSGSDFPTTPGAYDETWNGSGDVFVTKLDASGSALLWSTFLGGSSSDDTFFLALDAVGNPVVSGSTNSSDFPTTPGAFDESFNGEYDGFVAKLDASGSSLLWSTFLGGTLTDSSHDLALDSYGRLVVTGRTGSPDFPTTPGAHDESYNGSWDRYAVKLDAAGSKLMWARFSVEAAGTMVVDSGWILWQTPSCPDGPRRWTSRSRRERSTNHWAATTTPSSSSSTAPSARSSGARSWGGVGPRTVGSPSSNPAGAPSWRG